MAAVESIQLSTSFLILNRIQAIVLPSLNVTTYRHYLQYTSLGVFSFSFIVIFIICFQRGYAPVSLNETGEFSSWCWFYNINFDILACVAFACRMLGQLNDLTMYKMIIGLVNICCGGIFVFLYFRYARKSSIRRENRVSVRCFFVFRR